MSLPLRSIRGPAWVRPVSLGVLLLLAALAVVVMAWKLWREGSSASEAAEYLVVAAGLGAAAAVLFWFGSRLVSGSSGRF
jgi:hypothetical protein